MTVYFLHHFEDPQTLPLTVKRKQKNQSKAEFKKGNK